jgi:hypothetical protein
MKRKAINKLLIEQLNKIDAYEVVGLLRGLVVADTKDGKVNVGVSISNKDKSRNCCIVLSPRCDNGSDWNMTLKTKQIDDTLETRDLQISTEMLYIIYSAVSALKSVMVDAGMTEAKERDDD